MRQRTYQGVASRRSAACSTSSEEDPRVSSPSPLHKQVVSTICVTQSEHGQHIQLSIPVDPRTPTVSGRVELGWVGVGLGCWVKAERDELVVVIGCGCGRLVLGVGVDGVGVELHWAGLVGFGWIAGWGVRLGWLG